MRFLYAVQNYFRTGVSNVFMRTESLLSPISNVTIVASLAKYAKKAQQLN